MKYIFKKKLYVFIISLFDFIGKIIFLPFILSKKTLPGNIGKILIIRLDHIGDVIFSTVVPKNLKEHYKGAKITFLVSGWSKEIVLSNPNIDEVICYDAPWFDRNKRKVFEVVRFIKIAMQLRKDKYDIGFDLRGDLRHIILMALGGVKFRIGYGITGGGFLLHKEVKYRESVHSVERNLDLLKSMSINTPYREPEFYSSDKDILFIKDFFHKQKILKESFLVVLHPFANYSSKNWLENRFTTLMDELYNEYNATIILVGSTKDRNGIEKLIEASNAPAINAAGLTSLGALFEIINHSNVFIGIDSGPSHIAALNKKPSVVLYSGTNKANEWVPVSKNTIIIQKEIPCHGCGKLNCQDNICMDLISVDDVLLGVKEVLKRCE